MRETIAFPRKKANESRLISKWSSYYRLRLLKWHLTNHGFVLKETHLLLKRYLQILAQAFPHKQYLGKFDEAIAIDQTPQLNLTFYIGKYKQYK